MFVSQVYQIPSAPPPVSCCCLLGNVGNDPIHMYDIAIDHHPIITMSDIPFYQKEQKLWIYSHPPQKKEVSSDDHPPIPKLAIENHPIATSPAFSTAPAAPPRRLRA